MTNSQTLSHRQRGLGMIEILITVLVLSVGLMGLAALQGFSLQTNQDAYLRSQATNAVYEVIDHLRANRSVVMAGTVPDEAELEARVATLLPDGDLEITIDSADDGIVTVTVTWFDDRRTDDSDAQQLSFSATSRV